MIDEIVQTFAIHPGPTLCVFGILIGLMFGALVERTGFCAMGGVTDAVLLSDKRRLQSWFLAAAIAILGVLFLDLNGIVDFSKSRYLSTPITLVGNIIGGLIFGYGMVLSGGCVSKNLVRAGAGDIRALIAVGVVAFFAFITLTGLFSPWRNALSQTTQIAPADIGASSPAIPALLAATSLVSEEVASIAIPIAIVASVFAYVFSDPSFRSSPRHIVSGTGIGILAIAAWTITGLTYDELALTPLPPTSLSFVAPVGETFEWMRRSTALTALPTFAVASVLGTLLGAYVSAMLAGRFKLATFADASDTVRTLSGAALMGVGGVLAQGCTIGQAVSGVSTLAVGSFVAFAGMIAGATVCVKRLALTV